MQITFQVTLIQKNQKVVKRASKTFWEPQFSLDWRKEASQYTVHRATNLYSIRTKLLSVLKTEECYSWKLEIKMYLLGIAYTRNYMNLSDVPIEHEYFFIKAVQFFLVFQ